MTKTKIPVTPKNWLVNLPDKELYERVKKILTLKDTSYKAVWPHKKMYGEKGFKTGLIDFINERVTDIELYTDIPKLPLLENKDIKLLGLRDYQIEATNSILSHTRGIVSSPTASGKTMMEIALCLKLPKPIVFLVPSTDLISHAYREMKKFGITKKYNVTIYGGGTFKDTSGDIVIMTNQSLVRQSAIVKSFMKRCKSIISDEVHHSTGKLYSILGKCPALYRAGFSATPWADDWTDIKYARLISNFGKQVYDGYEDDRIDIFRMKPTVYVAKYKNKDKTISPELLQAVENHDYIEQKRHEIVKNNGRNKFIVQLAEILRLKGLHTFIVVDWTQHIDTISIIAKQLNVPITFLTGEDDTSYRNNVYNNLRNSGTEPIIICGTVGSEGIDLIHLNAIIFASIGKSEIKIIQSIGRSARKHPDKKIAMCIDIMDPFFSSHMKKRHKLYKKEGYDVRSIKELLSDQIK